MEKQCLECGKTFSKKQNQSVKTWDNVVKYCSKKCQIIGIGRVAGKRLIALNKSRIGKPLSEETKRKMIIKRKGKTPFKGYKHTEEEKKRIKESMIKAQTPEARFKSSLSRRGEKNPNWKDGRTGLKHQLRTGFRYRQWRSDIFTRDNFTCINCGDNKGRNLEADHIIPLNIILDKYNIKTLEEVDNCEELWNINNGRTFCEKCHIKRHQHQIKQ